MLEHIRGGMKFCSNFCGFGHPTYCATFSVFLTALSASLPASLTVLMMLLFFSASPLLKGDKP